jgi:D-alanyl-D-alanine endopeptidase (penicillin-binding protein 7)
MRVFLCITALLFSSLIQAQPVTAKSWLIANSDGKIIAGENTNAMRPVASISKLLAVMIVLDAHQDLNEKLAFNSVHRQKQKKNKNFVDKEKKFTRQQLIDMAIVHSDNHATNILCSNYPGGSTDCISAMNFKAARLGMMHTSMSDPTGLDNRNISTAEDLIKLVHAARHYPEIVNASRQSKVEIQMKKKWLVFPNTNPMIGKDRRIVISKTGYTSPAGGCIVLGLDTELGERTVIVLGSKNTRTRIPEAEFISNIKE